MSSSCGPTMAGKAAASAPRRCPACRRPTASSGSRRPALARDRGRPHRPADARRRCSRPGSPRPRATGPSVPTTSGWPAWPTRIDAYSRAGGGSSASRCTLVTSGQVASMAKGCAPRPRRHCLGHAMRREDHRRVGRRDLVELLDEDGALLLQRFRPRICCARSHGAHRPEGHRASSARSTASMARITPAQKPRGAQSRICSGGFSITVYPEDLLRVLR